MHLAEMLVYATAFTQTYNENYPAYDHHIAIARAVRTAYFAVDALRHAPDNCAINNRKLKAHLEKNDFAGASRDCGPEVEDKWIELWRQFVTSKERA